LRLKPKLYSNDVKLLGSGQTSLGPADPPGAARRSFERGGTRGVHWEGPPVPNRSLVHWIARILGKATKATEFTLHSYHVISLRAKKIDLQLFNPKALVNGPVPFWNAAPGAACIGPGHPPKTSTSPAPVEGAGQGEAPVGAQAAYPESTGCCSPPDPPGPGVRRVMRGVRAQGGRRRRSGMGAGEGGGVMPLVKERCMIFK